MDKDNAQDTALVVTPTRQFGEIATAQPNVDLKAQLQFETERRAIVKEFIRDHLVEGIDYGGIHINKACPNKYRCTDKYHFSKPMLFKPGQEKFTSLFHFVSDYQVDYETKEMLGNTDGLICYSCTLYDYQGKFIARGKGAAGTSEGFDANKTIKMAKKRAKLDAISESGILADFFSIDAQSPTPVAKPAPQAPKPAQNSPSVTGCTCNTTNQYHNRACPLFSAPNQTPPAPVETVTEGEVVQPGSKLKNEEVVDLEELPPNL